MSNVGEAIRGHHAGLLDTLTKAFGRPTLPMRIDRESGGCASAR